MFLLLLYKNTKKIPKAHAPCPVFRGGVPTLAVGLPYARPRASPGHGTCHGASWHPGGHPAPAPMAHARLADARLSLKMCTFVRANAKV